jgi:hydrogenase nickel incorporation protein HypA/HybF
MHELSLAENLIEILEDEARRQGFRQVRRLWLDVGVLSAVEPAALLFAFDVAARGSCAEGAEVRLNPLPGEAWCPACRQVIEISTYHDPCPLCLGHGLKVTGGSQFQIKELEVI